MMMLILTAVVLLFVAPTTADIKSMKIRSDRRHRIVLENFEFTHTGYVSVAVSSATVTSRLLQPDPSRIGFYIFPKEALIPVDGNPNFCPLDSKFITLLFTFQDISPPPQASFHKLHQVTYPGEYILRFANCNPYSVVTMDVRTELYSTDAGRRKNYLSAGISQLPDIYLTFAYIYLCFLGVWVLLCFKKRHQPYFHTIHLLMSGLLVVSVLNLIFAAVDMGHVKVRGTSHGWNVVSYIFQFFRSVLVYLVMVLIGAGWSFVKSLRLVDKMILMILFILQCFGNVAFIMVIRETGPFDKNWDNWIAVYFVVEIMCFLATNVPTLCTIRWLRKVSEVDAKAARSLPDGVLFVQHYFLICFYLFCKTFYWHVKITREQEYSWVYNTGNNSAPEIINLVFYMLIFYMLRPVEKNRYSVRDVEHQVEVPESVPDKKKQFIVVCITRSKYEEAAKIGLWDEEDVL